MATINSIHPELHTPRTESNVENQLDPQFDTSSIQSAEDAAKQFEKILVQEFVKVMTEQMFESNLAGENGPGWMKSYGKQQQQTMTEILTDHLVEKGTFDISTTILQQWADKGFDIS